MVTTKSSQKIRGGVKPVIAGKLTCVDSRETDCVNSVYLKLIHSKRICNMKAGSLGFIQLELKAEPNTVLEIDCLC